MHRKELPRICELRDLLQGSDSPDNYFQNFDASVRDNPFKRRYLLDIEADLRVLDAEAWNALRSEVVPHFTRKHRTRGWETAFNTLNQAKGYNYLVRIGCDGVAFIPKSRLPGQKTPDLSASLGSTMVLCEVKTLNISDVEATARKRFRARSTEDQLSDAFFQKLVSTLETAEDQMACHHPADQAKRIGYVIVNFDDHLHEYVDGYWEQLRAFAAREPVPGIEIVFDIKPAFWTAMA